MKSIAVFCGSSFGNSPEFKRLAEELGTALAQRDLTLVFGGGNVGLMSVIADTVMDAGGKVIGVIPQSLLDKELGHNGISHLRITGSMHERKAIMEREAEGFIALPGGFGTLDEFCEILTWAQLGIHQKPCGLLDTGDGFFKHLLAFFDHIVDTGFVNPGHRDMVLKDTDPAALLDRMSTWTPTVVSKWTTPPKNIPRP